MKGLSGIVVLFALIASLQAFTLEKKVEKAGDDFNEFLRDALEKYPKWLSNNNLIPSPPSQVPANLRINRDDLQLTCTISNEQVVGFGNQSSQFVVTTVLSSVAISWIIIQFDYNGEVSYQGNYNASGTIGDVPINGTGSWAYTSKIGIHENVQAIFSVNNAGYVTIDDYYFIHGVVPIGEGNDEIYFEGLWDDVSAGNAEVIKERLREAYSNRLGDSGDSVPNRVMMFQYLTEVFKEKPLADMIGQK